MFEYLDLDLKKLMDALPGFSSDHRLIKVTTSAVVAAAAAATSAAGLQWLECFNPSEYAAMQLVQAWWL